MIVTTARLADSISGVATAPKSSRSSSTYRKMNRRNGSAPHRRAGEELEIESRRLHERSFWAATSRCTASACKRPAPSMRPGTSCRPRTKDSTRLIVSQIVLDSLAGLKMAWKSSFRGERCSGRRCADWNAIACSVRSRSSTVHRDGLAVILFWPWVRRCGLRIAVAGSSSAGGLSNLNHGFESNRATA